MLSLEDVRAAAERIKGTAHRTPVLTCQTLDELSGAKLFFKAECFQKAGAFKFRGAFNTLSSLTPAERLRGVVASSSGNHAQAVALAGRLLGVRVTVVMPNDAPIAKKRGTLGYGARVVGYDRQREDREKIALDLAQHEGCVLVPAYDDYRVMAGQGTAALELLEDVPNLDAFIAPVSGGGLIAGCATVIAALSPSTKVIGAEPETADDTRRSLEAGQRLHFGVPDTFADGLRVPVPGELTFPINSRLLDSVLVASDPEIAQAIRLLLFRQKIVVEPSGAVGLAALMRHRERFAGKRVGILLSGGNIDAGVLSRIATEEQELDPVSDVGTTEHAVVS